MTVLVLLMTRSRALPRQMREVRRGMHANIFGIVVVVVVALGMTEGPLGTDVLEDRRNALGEPLWGGKPAKADDRHRRPSLLRTRFETKVVGELRLAEPAFRIRQATYNPWVSLSQRSECSRILWEDSSTDLNLLKGDSFARVFLEQA